MTQLSEPRLNSIHFSLCLTWTQGPKSSVAPSGRRRIPITCDVSICARKVVGSRPGDGRSDGPAGRRNFAFFGVTFGCEAEPARADASLKAKAPVHIQLAASAQASGILSLRENVAAYAAVTAPARNSYLCNLCNLWTNFGQFELTRINLSQYDHPQRRCRNEATGVGAFSVARHSPSRGRTPKKVPDLLCRKALRCITGW